MPYASNKGVKIHYEVEGTGRPLLLYHGAFQRIESWRDSGFVEQFKNHYQLILLDARGHGLSDKPHIPEAYRMKLLVSDAVSVLDDLGVFKANFLGFSSGGYVGFGAMRYAKNRFNSLILGGAQPYDKWVESWRPGWSELMGKDKAAALDASVRVWGGRLSEELRALYDRNDVEALGAWMRLFEPLKLDSELPKTRFPCLLFCGDEDEYGWIGAGDRIRVIPRGRYVALEGAGGHFESFYRPDLLRPRVDEFLNNISKK